MTRVAKAMVVALALVAVAAPQAEAHKLVKKLLAESCAKRRGFLFITGLHHCPAPAKAPAAPATAASSTVTPPPPPAP